MNIAEAIQFLQDIQKRNPRDQSWDTRLLRQHIHTGGDGLHSTLQAALTDAVHEKYVHALRKQTAHIEELVLRHAEGEIQDNAYGRALFHLMMSQQTGGWYVGTRDVRLYHAGQAEAAFQLIWPGKSLGECLKLILDAANESHACRYVRDNWDALTKLWLDYVA